MTTYATPDTTTHLSSTHPSSTIKAADNVTQLPTPAAPPIDWIAIRNKALLRFAISISVLNIIGHLLLGFEQAPIVPVLTVLTAYASSLLIETLDAWAHRRPPEYGRDPKTLFYFLLPAHISALACGMLIYADNTWPYLFATVIAVCSKYLLRFRVNGRLRHYMNPSNFGIGVTLLLMPTVGFVAPYQFTNNVDQPFDWLIPGVIVIAGTLLNAKLTMKMPLIFGWVAGFVLQAVLRTLLFDDNLIASLGVMTGVAFVLYTNYMITDPGTSPVPKPRQALFGLSVALAYGALVVAGISYALFFSLCIVCLFRGLSLAYSGARSRRLESRRTVVEEGARDEARASAA